MRNYYLIATVLAVAAMTPLGLLARAQHERMENYTQCAKVCSDCQLQCDGCFKHCLTMMGDAKPDHAKTVQTCADCGECCKLAATLCGRSSPFCNPACDCCAKCCDECALACEKFPDDKHMAMCAKSCRDCAKACRNMVSMVKK